MIATSRSDVRRFFRLHGRAYAGEPGWVHPAFGLQRRILRGRGAFNATGRVAAWLHGDAACAAFVDPRYGGTGFIGLVASAPGAGDDLRSVVAAGEGWLADSRVERIVAPVAGHVLYGFGFLEHGDGIPVVGTSWTRPDELRCFRELGYEDAARFVSYSITLDDDAVASARSTPDPSGIVIRPASRVRFRRDVATMTALRNETFAHLFADAPLRADEGWELFGRMRVVLVPDLALIAYEGEEPIGFVLCFPDFNQAFAGSPTEPSGIRAAGALAVRRRAITRAALGEIGVVASHRGRGIASALLAKVMLAAASHRYTELRYLLVQEDNVASRRTAERAGGRPVSTHVLVAK